MNGKPETLMRGLCTVGTPPEKRYALSQLTLELCKLSHTTDSLHLCLLELGLPFAVFDLCYSMIKRSTVPMLRPRREPSCPLPSVGRLVRLCEKGLNLKEHTLVCFRLPKSF